MNDSRMSATGKEWAERVILQNQGTPYDLAFWDDQGSYALYRLPTRIEGVPCFFWEDFVKMWSGRGYHLSHEYGRKYHAFIFERRK